MVKVFDKVLSSVPVDELARRVTSPGPKLAGHSKKNNCIYDSWLPIPLLPKRLYPWAPCFHDFTGLRIGRLTVLGIAEEPIKTKWDRFKWVVRCNCGMYSLRGTAKLRKSSRNPESHMCEVCNMRENGKRTDRWKMTGVDQC